MATCRCCGAVVHWRRTMFGGTIPINDAPSDAGRIILFDDDSIEMLSDDMAARVDSPMYQSHYDTCTAKEFLELKRIRYSRQQSLFDERRSSV